MNNIGLISENDNSTVLAEYTGLNRVTTSYQSEEALEKELIKTLVELGYERLNINSEDELILNLRKQLEKLNNYHFTDGEWDDFFTKVIANKNDYIIEKTRLIQEDYKQEITLDSVSYTHLQDVLVYMGHLAQVCLIMFLGVVVYLKIMPSMVMEC